MLPRNYINASINIQEATANLINENEKWREKNPTRAKANYKSRGKAQPDSRRQLLYAERVQHGVERRLGVAQRQVDPRPVEQERQAHLVARLEAPQGDGGALAAVVRALADQVVALGREGGGCGLRLAWGRPLRYA